MMFMMLVTLYTSRVVLQMLGAEDYGIYNVVGGVVAMFGFLNASMTGTTQRYLNFELGKGDYKRLREVFVTSVNIHILISVIVVVLAETVGLWFVYNKLVIPADRMIAAIWVYQMSILTTVIAMMSYPYNAAIIAHEKMSAFAYISVFEVILRLGIVFLLPLFGIDKLLFYAVLVAVVQLLIRFIYSGYCAKHFPETKFFFFYDTPLSKEMLSFAGWNLWGNCAAILYGQGINILLNMFFGPIVNAARAVCSQVEGAVATFSSNFQTALNPQITKSYANGNLSYMHSLVFRSSRFTFLLLFCLALPIYLECSTILNIWLTEVPENTIIFLRIMLTITIVDACARPFMVAASATGKIKRYQSVVGGLLLSILPISYIALRFGADAWVVFVVHLCVATFTFWVRLLIIRPLVKISIRAYIKQVIVPCVFVAFTAIVFPLLIHLFFTNTLIGSLSNIALSMFCACIASFAIGLTNKERQVITSKAKQILDRIN